MMNSYRPKECDSFAPLLVHSLKKKKNSIYQTPGIVRGTGHKTTEKIKFTVFMEILNSSTGVDKLQSTDQI